MKGLLGWMKEAVLTLLIGFWYGPGAVINRRSLQLHLANPSTVALRWIMVEAIGILWMMVPYGTVILILHALGADSAVMGWLSLLLMGLTAIVIGTNPRFGHVFVWGIVSILVAVLVVVLLKQSLVNITFIRAAVWLVFDSGVSLNPCYFGAIVIGCGLLSVGETIQKYIMRDNSVDGNHFYVRELFGNSTTLRRDEYTPNFDVSDFLEHTLCSMVTIVFTPGDAAKPAVLQPHVPWGRRIAMEVMRLASETNVEIHKPKR